MLILQDCSYGAVDINCPFNAWSYLSMKIHDMTSKYGAQNTELGTYPYLETLTLFVSPPTAVSLGGRQAYKKG